MEKVCCNCGHCVRKGEVPNIECYCDIDDKWLSYLTVMEYKCKHWVKEKARKK